MENKVPPHIQEIMDGFDQVERHTHTQVPASAQSPGVSTFQRKQEFEGRQINPDVPLAPILVNSRAMMEKQMLENTQGEHNSPVKFEKPKSIKIE